MLRIEWGMKRKCQLNQPSGDAVISFKGYRFPPDVISYAVWLYYRFPLSLRMIEEMLAARGIDLTYETLRRWSTHFGLAIAKQIRTTALGHGDKWHLDEMVVSINGEKHWLWRAVDQQGVVLDVLVQGRRDKAAAKRLMRKLLKRFGRPRVLVTDKLRSYAAANDEIGLNVDHRQHKGLNNRAENSHEPTRVREKVMRRFKVGASPSTVHISPRAGCQPVHELQLQSKRSTQTRGPRPGHGGLAKGFVRPLGGVSRFIHAFSASTRPLTEQVDNTCATT